MKNPIVITLLAFSLFLCGCASTGGNADQRLYQKMTQLIGKTPQEATAIIGQPQRTSFRISENGHQDLYIYSYPALLEKLEGFWAGFKYGMGTGVGAPQKRTITVTLFADKVVAIEGF